MKILQTFSCLNRWLSTTVPSEWEFILMRWKFHQGKPTITILLLSVFSRLPNTTVKTNATWISYIKSTLALLLLSCWSSIKTLFYIILLMILIPVSSLSWIESSFPKLEYLSRELKPLPSRLYLSLIYRFQSPVLILVLKRCSLKKESLIKGSSKICSKIQ